jgi:hypothetical protein
VSCARNKCLWNLDRTSEANPRVDLKPFMAPRGPEGADKASIVASVMVTISHASLPAQATFCAILPAVSSNPDLGHMAQTPLNHGLCNSVPLVLCEQSLQRPTLVNQVSRSPAYIDGGRGDPKIKRARNVVAFGISREGGKKPSASKSNGCLKQRPSGRRNAKCESFHVRCFQ